LTFEILIAGGIFSSSLAIATDAAERLIRSGTDVWWRASGGVARELKKLEAAKKAKEEEWASKSRQYN
jgi:cytochrome c heme-lyase